MSVTTFYQPSTTISSYLPLTINYFSADDEVNINDWLIDFEYVAKVLRWSDVEKYNAIPVYLQGTAKRWYKAMTDVSVKNNNVPKDYTSLKNRMIEDLCWPDYELYLTQKFHQSAQRKGQSSIAFIYEMYELCLRIYQQMPEILMVNLIKEKLLSQIKYGVELQNPKSLYQLIKAAKLAERAMHSCSNPFELPSQEIVQLQIELEKIEKRLDRVIRYKNGQQRKYTELTESNCNRQEYNHNVIENKAGITYYSNDCGLPDNNNYTSTYEQTNAQPLINCVSSYEPKLESSLNQETIKDPILLEDKNKDYAKYAGNSEAKNAISIPGSNSKIKLIRKSIKVNGLKVDSLLDTGSEISCISQSLVDALNLQACDFDTLQPICINNQKLPTLGRVKVKIKITDKVRTAILNTDLLIIRKLPAQFGVLIGQDLLSTLEAQIDCHNKSIKIKQYRYCKNRGLFNLAPGICNRKYK